MNVLQFKPKAKPNVKQVVNNSIPELLKKIQKQQDWFVVLIAINAALAGGLIGLLIRACL